MLPENVKKRDKVRCIDGTFYEDSYLPFNMRDISLPKNRKVYTVRNTEKGFHGDVGIRLEEIINTKFRFSHGGLKEPIFSLSRFKLVE